MAIFDLSSQDSGPPPTRPSQAKGKAVFPLKTALAITVAVAVLALWHFFRDPAKGLAPQIFAEAFQLRWPQAPAPPVPPKPKPVIAGALPDSPYLVDATNQLDPVFAALWKLEQGKTGTKGGGLVTILHYGDSPTTADLITGDIRAQLQSRFGDAGRGYTLIAKPWAWYGHRGVEMSDSGWKIRHGVGLMRQGVYGMGGAAFEGQPGAWSKFRLTESEQSAAEIEYLARPEAGGGGGSFVVEADGKQIAEQSTSAETQSVGYLHVDLPPGTKEVTLRPTSGPPSGTVTLFGIDFRRGTNGVLYDSLGLNGATTSVVARVLEPGLWQQQLKHAAPALIVVNYGSNESSFGNFVHKQYADELRLAITRIRTASPGTPILIMSPMDRGERAGLNDIETMATIPEIVAIQRQVAAETHSAFFDTYDAMGGNGTMSRWFAASPRLVTADLLHPTPQGAAIVGGLFVDQLGLRYDRWKMQHGIALPKAQARPALKAAPKAAPKLASKPGLKSAPQTAPAPAPQVKPALPQAAPDQTAPVPTEPAPTVPPASPASRQDKPESGDKD
jgi:lysophospholipase L1-like esterase